MQLKTIRTLVLMRKQLMLSGNWEDLLYKCPRNSAD